MYNIDEIKRAALGGWRELLTNLYGLDDKTLSGRHGPCPSCGGRDRFRFDDKKGTGSHYCNGCGAGDGLNLACKLDGGDFGRAIANVAGYLGISPETPEKAVEVKYVKSQDANRLKNSKKVSDTVAMAGVIQSKHDNCLHNVNIATGKTILWKDDVESMKEFSNYAGIMLKNPSIYGLSQNQVDIIAGAAHIIEDIYCLSDPIESNVEVFDPDDVVSSIRKCDVTNEIYSFIADNDVFGGVTQNEILLHFKLIGVAACDILGALSEMLNAGNLITIQSGKYKVI